MRDSDPSPEPKRRPLRSEDLAAQLASRIVGQPGALDAIIPSVQLHLSGLAPDNRPVGVFLLLGPTGTGKTRTVEALADVLHGDPGKVLRVECGEFQSDHEIAKLIGAPPGYVGHAESKPRLTQGALAEALSRECDLALVLFDEIEKAAPALYQLLLGILDRARLRLGDGTEVDFSKTLIFLTSNLGARDMLEELSPTLGFGTGAARDPGELRQSIERIGTRAVRKHFSPEFVNRIDAVVTYRPLEASSTVAILAQHIEDLQRHVHTRLGGNSFAIVVEPTAQYFMIDKGVSVEYGARELRRVIHRNLTQPLAAMVANGEVPPGSTVTVRLNEDGQSLRLETTAGVARATREIHTVLVVDDHAAILDWISRLLTKQGLAVIVAAGVEEARARVAETPPDVAILDHVLPDGEGVALAAELIESVPDIRILMMSGFELSDEDRRFVHQYDLPQLTKPFLGEELLGALELLRTEPFRARARGA
jgi:CheY-like chemotaxis protein/energy-coupling factor transporter ATP-binding protein EcfA2